MFREDPVLFTIISPFQQYPGCSLDYCKIFFMSCLVMVPVLNCLALQINKKDHYYTFHYRKVPSSKKVFFNAKLPVFIIQSPPTELSELMMVA